MIALFLVMLLLGIIFIRIVEPIKPENTFTTTELRNKRIKRVTYGLFKDSEGESYLQVIKEEDFDKNKYDE